MQMTKERWKQLSDKEQWDIKVALRGPDCHNSELVKWFSTAILRHHMAKVMRVGGTINELLPFMILPDSSSILTKTERETLIGMGVERLMCNFPHFTEHIRAAAGIAGIPLWYVPKTTFRKTFMGAGYGNIPRAIKEYIPYLPPEQREFLRELLKSQWGITVDEVV